MVTDSIGIKEYHPDEDLMLIQGNTQGFLSWRNIHTGSIMITAACNALSKYNKSNDHHYTSIDDAIHVIRYQVKQRINAKQIVQLTSTTVDKIYLQKN